jgi:hypothetical protein
VKTKSKAKFKSKGNNALDYFCPEGWSTTVPYCTACKKVKRKKIHHQHGKKIICYKCGKKRFAVKGCTDPNAFNYDITATCNDGSCCYVLGCMDPGAANYNPAACEDDGSCCYILGCTNPSALNYNPSACYDDGSCCYSNPTLTAVDGNSYNISSTACLPTFEYATGYGSCGQSAGITLVNDTNHNLTVTVSGGVDDDVEINGSVYEYDQHIYWADGSPCGGGKNGAHSFTYTQSMPVGSSITIKGIDNGFGGNISCTISFSLV